MAFFEVHRVAAGAAYALEGPLAPNQSVQGKLHGKPADLVVLDDDALALNGVVLKGNQAAVLFDTEGKLIRVHRLIRHISVGTVLRIELMKNLIKEPFGESYKTDLAEVLGNLYKEQVTAMGLKNEGENLPFKLGQWTISLLF